jgi:hypothetical protein
LYAFIPVADDPTTAIGAKNILARYRANYVKPPELKKKPTCFSYLHGTIKATIGGKVITETLNSSDVMGSGICDNDDDQTYKNNILDFYAVSSVTKQIVPKADGAAAFNRCACSEYKLLKKLARKMGIIQKGDKGTNVTGTIVLACERDFCASCVKVMDQFETSMFKGIKFIRLEKVKEAGADSENGQ